MTQFSSDPWDGSPGRWPDAASYCRSAMVDNNPSGAEKTKDQCHFPIRAPGSQVVNVNALRAVVGGRGAQAKFPGAQAARERARRLLQESQNSRSTNRSHEEVVENERRPVYRSTQPEELIFRSAEGEAGVVEGRVVPYEEWTEVDSMLEGHFMESFAHGSMSKTIMERGKGVQVYMDHGRSPQYGRQPVAQLEDTWEDSTGVFFRAALLKGLPEFFMDGLRKGLYGASLGADAIRTLYRRWPVKSDYNPDGIEERVRQEVRAFDYSLTSRPIYASATLTFRSIEDEFFVEQVRSLAEKHPEGLLQMFRSAIEVESEPPAEPEKPEQPQEEEAEPPHSEPPAPEDPDAGKASRDTQPPLIDYLAEDEEEEDEWRL